MARQDTLWHKRVRPLNIGGPSRPVVTRSGKTGQFPLNPKVQGSIPCASTNMLCPRASGLPLVYLTCQLVVAASGPVAC